MRESNRIESNREKTNSPLTTLIRHPFSSFESSNKRAQPQAPPMQQQQHHQHHQSPLNYSRYVHTPQPQDVTYETVSAAASNSGQVAAQPHHHSANNSNHSNHNHHIIYENLQVVGQRAQPQATPAQAVYYQQPSAGQSVATPPPPPPPVQPAILMRATDSPLSSSSSPPRPIAPQSYQANVVAPAVATSLKHIPAAVNSHSPQHSKTGSMGSNSGGGGGGNKLVATVAHPAHGASHYQAMRPISMSGSSVGGGIYQNAAQMAGKQFIPVYSDDGSNSDYVCMLAGGSSSMMDSSGGGGGNSTATYQPIFATSAAVINDTPVKVQAYKADSVSIAQLPTASTAVAASQPTKPPPALLKKTAETKPKVNPLAASSNESILMGQPQRRTPSLPPSSPTPSNLSSGSGSGRGEDRGRKLERRKSFDFCFFPDLFQ